MVERINLNHPFFGEENPIMRRLSKNNIPYESWLEYKQCVRFYALPYRIAHKILKADGLSVSRGVLDKALSIEHIWELGNHFKNMGMLEIDIYEFFKKEKVNKSAWYLIKVIFGEKKVISKDKNKI